MDSNKNINISAWFRGTNTRLTRCLNSDRFKALLNSVCEIKNKKPDEVMYKDKHGDVYVTLVLALYAARYLILSCTLIFFHTILKRNLSSRLKKLRC